MVSTSWLTGLTSRSGPECISHRSGGRGLGWLAAVVQPRVDTQVVMVNLAWINSLPDITMGFCEGKGRAWLYNYMKDRLQSSSTDLGNIELLCFEKKSKY